MKTQLRRIFTSALVLTLLLSSVPTAAFAAEPVKELLTQEAEQVLQDEETPFEKAEGCICTELCTEAGTLDCPVCTADPTKCQGQAAAEEEAPVQETIPAEEIISAEEPPAEEVLAEEALQSAPMCTYVSSDGTVSVEEVTLNEAVAALNQVDGGTITVTKSGALNEINIQIEKNMTIVAGDNPVKITVSPDALANSLSDTADCIFMITTYGTSLTLGRPETPDSQLIFDGEDRYFRDGVYRHGLTMAMTWHMEDRGIGEATLNIHDGVVCTRFPGSVANFRASGDASNGDCKIYMDGGRLVDNPNNCVLWADEVEMFGGIISGNRRVITGTCELPLAAITAKIFHMAGDAVIEDCYLGAEINLHGNDTDQNLCHVMDGNAVIRNCGDVAERRASGGIEMYGGTLILQENAKIENCKGLYSGAVYCDTMLGSVQLHCPTQFIMQGHAVIDRCTASMQVDSTQANIAPAGGVFMGTGSGSISENAVIQNCTGYVGGITVVAMECYPPFNQFRVEGSAQIRGNRGVIAGGMLAENTQDDEMGQQIKLGGDASLNGNIAEICGGGLTVRHTAYTGGDLRMDPTALNGIFMGDQFKITGNTAGKYGGGIAVVSTRASNSERFFQESATDSKLHVTGGKISENTAAIGGGICVAGSAENREIFSLAENCFPDIGILNLSGGTIRNNKATNKGGGIYVGLDGAVNLSGGSIMIRENRGADDQENNIYLPNGSGDTGRLIPGRITSLKNGFHTIPTFEEFVETTRSEIFENTIYYDTDASLLELLQGSNLRDYSREHYPTKSLVTLYQTVFETDPPAKTAFRDYYQSIHQSGSCSPVYTPPTEEEIQRDYKKNLSAHPWRVYESRLGINGPLEGSQLTVFVEGAEDGKIFAYGTQKNGPMSAVHHVTAEDLSAFRIENPNYGIAAQQFDSQKAILTTDNEPGEPFEPLPVENVSYRVQYFYNGEYDPNEDFIGTGEDNTVITEYPDNPREKFALDHVENLPLTLSSDGQDHVIKVYYEPDVVGAENGSDGIPDQYQSLVTYQVVNGTFADRTQTKQELLTFVDRWNPDTNCWETSQTSLQLNVPVDMQADEHYNQNSGKWDQPPAISLVKPGENRTFKYTFDNVTYTIIYTDAGTFPADLSFETESHTAFYGDNTPVFQQENPTRSNYVFTGWTPEVADIVTGDMLYTATWALDQNNNGQDDATEEKYTVVYTDGVADAEVFPDQHFGEILPGMPSPKFKGTPARTGYIFMGWEPAVADTVTDNVTYAATWVPDQNADGVPDIYQAKVTYRVVGGAFSDQSKEKIVVYTLYESTDGQWNELENVTLGNTIPTDMTPTSGYHRPGKWDAAIDQNTAVTNGAVYTYSFTKDSGSRPTPARPDKPVLNTKDHYSYIVGFRDGYLRPYNTITRGEVATIFFRLLTDEARDKYWCQTNRYTDVPTDLWCNNAISTLSNMGIIDGFADGSFRPRGTISRAQFAKMAVGFFEMTAKEYEGYFADVTPDAWYTSYVEAAARVGLISGFADGTFRPNALITRAQACVIVNRALDRHPDEEHLLPAHKMITWPDNNPGDWFYADMQEATNSHDYHMITSSIKDPETGKRTKVEEWTKKLEQRDWAAFEHAWADAHSSDFDGEVVG